MTAHGTAHTSETVSESRHFRDAYNMNMLMHRLGLISAVMISEHIGLLTTPSLVISYINLALSSLAQLLTHRFPLNSVTEPRSC